MFKADKEMWAYAYEDGIGLSINMTTHFTTTLSHKPQLWQMYGSTPMIKVGSLDLSTPLGDVFAVLDRKDSVTLVTVDNRILGDDDVRGMTWLEPFSWIYNSYNHNALRGLILFHLYSHEYH